MRSSRARLREMVDRRYRSQAQLERHRRRVAEGLRAWERAVAERFMPAPGRVLDYGCGGGREAFALESLGHSVIGVDVSPEQVALARRIGAERNSAVEFQRCDGERLEHPTGSFDYAIAWSQVLANVPGSAQRLTLLRELARVLGPGGCLSFSAHDRARSLAAARQLGLLEGSGRLGLELEEGDFILRDGDSGSPCYWHYFSRGELEEIVREAGLARLDLRRSSELGEDHDSLWICVARKL